MIEGTEFLFKSPLRESIMVDIIGDGQYCIGDLNDVDQEDFFGLDLTGQWKILQYAWWGDGSYLAIWVADDPIETKTILNSPSICIWSDSEPTNTKQNIMEYIRNRLKIPYNETEYEYGYLNDYEEAEISSEIKLMIKEIDNFIKKHGIKTLDRGDFNPPVIE